MGVNKHCNNHTKADNSAIKEWAVDTWNNLIEAMKIKASHTILHIV